MNLFFPLLLLSVVTLMAFKVEPDILLQRSLKIHKIKSNTIIFSTSILLFIGGNYQQYILPPVIAMHPRIRYRCEFIWYLQRRMLLLSYPSFPFESSSPFSWVFILIGLIKSSKYRWLRNTTYGGEANISYDFDGYYEYTMNKEESAPNSSISIMQ